MKTARDSEVPSSADLRQIQEGFGDLVDEMTAADLLDMKVRTLQDWRHRGVGPPFVKMGAAKNALVRYPLAQLRAYLERHLVPTGSASDPQVDTAPADSGSAGQPSIHDPSETTTRRQGP